MLVYGHFLEFLNLHRKYLMKIFIIYDYFHPAYKAGGPIQSIANMVWAMGNCANGQSTEKNVKQPGYSFRIFCSNKDLDGSLITGVPFDVWVDYNACTKVWYSSNDNILLPLQAAIKNDKPDCLFINGIYSWAYNVKPLLICKGVKKIVSVRGMLHPGALSQKSFKKKIYLLLWKILGLHKKNSFHATDEQEKKYIQQVFGNRTAISVAANFPRVFKQQPIAEKKTGHLKMVSVALISPMKNILLVLEALRDLSSELSVVSKEKVVLSSEFLVGRLEVEYNIYGTVKDAEYWRQCAEIIKQMPYGITVNYHGAVDPALIEKALAENHVFILPSKSENFGHSIIEALSAGRPVITSTTTPWNKLEVAQAGINVSLSDVSEIVKAIGSFAAMNMEQLQQWSNGAREYADHAIDMETVETQYEKMFETVG